MVGCVLSVVARESCQLPLILCLCSPRSLVWGCVGGGRGSPLGLWSCQHLGDVDQSVSAGLLLGGCVALSCSAGVCLCRICGQGRLQCLPQLDGPG